MLKSDEPTVAKELENFGSDEVRRKLGRGEYGDIGSDLQLFVERWATNKEATRKSKSDARSESREETALSIAREANALSREANSISSKARSDSRKARSVARRANTNAIIAMILTGIMSIAAMSDKFIPFLRWLGILKP